MTTHGVWHVGFLRKLIILTAIMLVSATVHTPLSAERRHGSELKSAGQGLKARGVERIAGQVRGADGIAIDRAREHIYIAEEYNDRVIRLDRDGQPHVVISVETPIYNGNGATRTRTIPLRAPEGISWSSSEALYVTEDVPGGRLLRFPLSADETLPFGEVVDLPIPAHRIAWESVDTRADGALLLAGSSAEASSGDNLGAPVGIVLYRDDSGQWWIPIRRPFASYSAAIFDAGGRAAFVACEISGAVFALDLTSREVRLWVSRHTFASPESLALLPDGSLLVAEERGRILQLDPFSDRVDMWADSLGSIETAVYDEERSRALVTADEEGQLLAISTPRIEPARLRAALAYERPALSPLVPSTCPGYLAGVLRKAGYDPNDPAVPVSFPTLARRLSVFALDAVAELIHSSSTVEDPLTHVQMAIFAPNLMGIDLSAFTGPTGAFAARTASGKRIRTTGVSKRMLRADALAGTVAMLGPDTIPVPYPAGARLSPEGVASLHLHGLGLTADFSVVMNTFSPHENYLMVTEPGGGVSQYRLTPVAGKTIDSWVIAIRPSTPEPWTRLDHAAHLIVSGEESIPQS